MAFIKKFYLHANFGSWSLLKLFSIYAHSSIAAGLKKSSWNSSHNQLNQLHSFTLTEVTRNLQELQKGLCWSFELNKPGKQTVFQHFSAVNFLAALEELLKYSPIRGMACAMSHVILVSQLYCRVNDLGGKIPAASLLFVWSAGRSSPEICRMLSQRKFLRPFKAKWKLILQTIFGVCHWKIIAEWWSLESWEQRGNPIYGLLSLKLKSCRNLKTKQLFFNIRKSTKILSFLYKLARFRARG